MRVAIVMGPIVREQLTLWDACSDLGVDVTIIGADPAHEPGWPLGTDNEDDKCIQLTPITPAASRGHILWFYRRLGWWLRHLRPDLVHVASEPWGGLTLQTLLIARQLHPRIPICVQGADNIYWHGSSLEQSIRKLALHLALPRVTGFVSWNKDGVRLATEAGLKPSTQSRVLPAVVPDPLIFAPPTPEQRRELRSRYILPQNEVVVAYVGRLVEDKGVRDLLEALKRPEARQPFLAVWGSGRLAGLVEGAFRTDELRGRLGGSLDRGAVADALRSVDVLVVPSRSTATFREQFGRVVVEAMFSGCAVVAYASGALPDVVGDGGVLVAERDVDALSAAIGRLVSDDAHRQDTALRGREQALARFHPTAVGRDLIALWQELLS